METWSGGLACCLSSISPTQGKKEQRRRWVSWEIMQMFSQVPDGRDLGLTWRAQRQISQALLQRSSLLWVLMFTGAVSMSSFWLTSCPFWLTSCPFVQLALPSLLPTSPHERSYDSCLILLAAFFSSLFSSVVLLSWHVWLWKLFLGEKT